MRIGAIVIMLLATGCAQYMAIQQPSDIRTNRVRLGVDRLVVVHAYGPADSSEELDDGSLREFYSYQDGRVINRPGMKALRIILYTAGDVFTLFLSQVIWIPIELFLEGNEDTVVVTYEKVGDEWRVSALRSAEGVH